VTESAPPPDLSVVTFGCRLNALEGENVRALAQDAGVTDTVIVNTCAVTAEAVRQARQTIRRIRRERPSARIVATGCAAQIDPDGFAGMDEVDNVIGNAEKLAPAFWRDLPRADRMVVSDIMEVRETAAHLVDGFATRTRAFVEVQNGCDHRCTFCIIPYGRGPSRSVPMGAVVEQVKRLVGSGHSEVVLTGVDLTSYGGDLPGHPRLGDLVARILAHVPDLPRLRLSSIDSIEVDEALLEVVGDAPRLMPHLHLSLQAGDDMILKRMKRRHLREDAVRFCEEIRARRPDVLFGADIIAGFPTETEEMFDNTLAVIEDCGLTHVHVFPFSPREGTPAARMPQVPRRVVKERAARLRAAAAARLDAALSDAVGRTVEVLVEEDGRGRTPHYLPAAVDRGATPGEIVRGRVAKVVDGTLVLERTGP
jgi:threonylcarbamoyladenosine tRNA methylthiotransferase MtaB